VPQLIITHVVRLPFARFVDRDMFMRFRGGGIGHKSTQERTRVFEKQTHVLPREDDEVPVVDGVNSEEEPEDSEEENDDDELMGDEAGGDEMGGGEDGEEPGPWDEDENELEGYAQL
jgi:hypothetical protein